MVVGGGALWHGGGSLSEDLGVTRQPVRQLSRPVSNGEYHSEVVARGAQQASSEAAVSATLDGSGPALATRLRANVRCGRLAWLQVFPATAAGCLEEVRRHWASDCSHNHFVYADLTDNNCACAPPKANCDDLDHSPDIHEAKVSSLYKANVLMSPKKTPPRAQAAVELGSMLRSQPPQKNTGNGQCLEQPPADDDSISRSTLPSLQKFMFSDNRAFGDHPSDGPIVEVDGVARSGGLLRAISVGPHGEALDLSGSEFYSQFREDRFL